MHHVFVACTLVCCKLESNAVNLLYYVGYLQQVHAGHTAFKHRCPLCVAFSLGRSVLLSARCAYSKLMPGIQHSSTSALLVNFFGSKDFALCPVGVYVPLVTCIQIFDIRCLTYNNVEFQSQLNLLFFHAGGCCCD